MTEIAIELRALDLPEGREPAVDARELHATLQVRRDFTNWIRGRIEQYGFVEGKDYVCSPVPASKGRGGSNRRDYTVTLDMAKELAMVERTERGKLARAYFIDCERRARAASMAGTAPALADPAVLRRLLLQYAEKAEEMEDRLAQQGQQLGALSRICAASGAISITKAAKALQLPPAALFSWMQTNGWLYRSTAGGTETWAAYQPRITRGQLVHKVLTVERPDGTPKVVEQVLVTPKGLARLAELLEREDHS